ncbi:MAG TPA: class I SAM-dependent methyltransferase [Candidatus Sulfomarinibacteraceae bacterium]|nr:class I SAM-dependent methyltransferase [Candidatus Sulfomarinibacteraceae bacterium]
MNREDWNRRYREKELVWSAEPNRFLVEEVADLAPGRALDLGAGEGRNAIWLAERGWRVTAVDFSDVALEKARRIAAEREVGMETVHADLTEYRPEPASFDLVLLLYLHLPPPEMAGVVDRAARAVASGGTFLLIGHDRTNLERGHGGPRDPELLYDAEEIAGLLTGFEIEAAGTRRRPVATEQGTVSAIDCLLRARAVP